MDYPKKQEPMDIYTDILASKGKRFTNFIIDNAVRFLLIALMSIIAASLSILFNNDDMLLWMQNISKIEDLMISYFILLLYFFLFEFLTQRTLGKLITGTKVVMADGTKPDLKAIFIRSVSRIVPFDAFSFLGDPPIGWHDRWADTVVVDVKKYNEAVRLKNSFDEIGKE